MNVINQNRWRRTGRDPGSFGRVPRNDEVNVPNRLWSTPYKVTEYYITVSY